MAKCNDDDDEQITVVIVVVCYITILRHIISTVGDCTSINILSYLVSSYLS